MSRKTHGAHSLVTVFALALTLTLATGCVWTPELTRVKDDIASQLPGASFDREFSMSLGPVAIAVARLVTRFVPDAREAQTYLRDVSRVQVAVYNTSSMPRMSSVHMPEALRGLAAEGWEVAVKARQEDQLVWVLYRVEDEAVRELYVVALDDEELVLVKARGRLDRLVARALTERDDIPGVPHIPNEGSEF
jgi:hypothetical protein